MAKPEPNLKTGDVMVVQGQHEQIRQSNKRANTRSDLRDSTFDPGDICRYDKSKNSGPVYGSFLDGIYSLSEDKMDAACIYEIRLHCPQERIHDEEDTENTEDTNTQRSAGLCLQ